MLEIAIDVGGTFTDVVCLHDQQRLLLVKVPTTSDDLVQGVRQGVARVLELAEQPTTVVERFIHSTTIATNAILEQKGAITGVLMTAGFEDVLEIGRQKRSNMYDLFLDPETPIFLAPRRQRVGIRERLDAAGNILQPLDEQQVVQTVATLQQFYGVQSVAVCYLFSFINPVHEIRTRELIVQHFPDLTVSLSSEIDPVFREYERVCVTAFDAYLRPNVAVYMQRLADALSAMGIQSYELEVPLPWVLDMTCVAQAVAALHAAHQQVYGHCHPTHPVEFVNLRSVHSAPLPRPQLTVQAPSSSLQAARKGTRLAYFDEYQAYRDTPIYRRDLSPLGAQFDGPAIVEQPDTTTVVYPGFTCRIDDAGNFLLTLFTR